MLTVIHGLKSKVNKDLRGIKGVAGADGVSSYFYIRYSQNANGNPMTDSAENAVYIGTCSTTSNTAPSSYVSYKWSKIKGDTGSKGEQGIQGPKGSDGQTSYLHIKYSDDGKLLPQIMEKHQVNILEHMWIFLKLTVQFLINTHGLK